MKYVNQINALLVVAGAAVAGYALNETYFDPAIRPRVEVSIPEEPEEEALEPERGPAPALPPQLIGNTGAEGSSNPSARPSRSRTRPSGTVRENRPTPPPRPGARPQTRRDQPPVQRTIPRPTRAPTPAPEPARAERDQDADQEDAARPSRTRPVPLGARRPPVRPGQPVPEGTPPPEKRETTPPPPARSSMPGN